MSLAQPLISVIVTTYNHEKYIGEAVASVVGQTFGDVEVVVIDDGSTDRTGEIVRSFAYPRVRYLHQPNQGPSVATTTAVAACRGTYLAFMSGDDVLHPDRLRKQLEAYRQGPTRVLFSGVEYIDDDGRPLAGEFYQETVSESHPTRAQLLERMFCSRLGVFGVTAFTELRVIRECGPDDPALFQTQDYSRWIGLLKKYEFEILPDRLYRFRIRTGWENLSGPQPEKQIRARTEMYLVMKSFFEGMPTELFRESFRAHLIRPEFTSETEKACEQGFLYLHSSEPLNQLIGVERLHALLHDPQARELLKRTYQFDFIRFAETLKRLNVTNLFTGQNSVVLVEQGDGWRPENMVRQLLNPHVPQFQLVFDLARFTSPRIIAWMPFEEPRLGQVKVERFRYRDTNDVLHDLGPGDLSCHACTRVGDYHVFDTVEPRLYFSPPGPVKHLEIVGRLELVPPGESFSRLTTALAEKQATIDRLTGEIERLKQGWSLRRFGFSRFWRRKETQAAKEGPHSTLN
jgi:glycosyltransferase involved in cell wall biosynthesis